MFRIGDVVQFTENHKWRGCLGIVNEVKNCRNKTLEWDTKYMICVPIPQQGTAFIFVMESENNIELIGKAVLVPKNGESNEWKKFLESHL